MENPQPESITCQVLFSVSKRRFKHAVDRNRAKRQMREAWRLNRNILNTLNPQLPPTPSPTLHIAFLWLSDTPQSSSFVHRKMKNLLHRIKENLESKPF